MFFLAYDEILDTGYIYFKRNLVVEVKWHSALLSIHLCAGQEPLVFLQLLFSIHKYAAGGVRLRIGDEVEMSSVHSNNYFNLCIQCYTLMSLKTGIHTELKT